MYILLLLILDCGASREMLVVKENKFFFYVENDVQ